MKINNVLQEVTNIAGWLKVHEYKVSNVTLRLSIDDFYNIYEPTDSPGETVAMIEVNLYGIKFTILPE